MLQLNQFYTDFPLTYLSSNNEDKKLEGIPPSLELSHQKLIQDEENETEEEDETIILGNQIHKLMYLNAIGIAFNAKDFKEDVNKVLLNLFETGQISQTKYGFVGELQKSQQKELIEIRPDQIETSSYQELRRFSFSRGVMVTERASHLELQTMCKWIERNEHDQINFYKMTIFMQQAIDLSVLAQNASRFVSKTKAHDTINDFLEKGTLITKQMIREGLDLEREAAQTNEQVLETADLKFRAEFSEKAVKSITERQIRTFASDSHAQDNNSNASDVQMPDQSDEFSHSEEDAPS